MTRSVQNVACYWCWSREHMRGAATTTAVYDAFTRVAALARTSDDAELNAFRLLGLAQATASRGESVAAMALFDEAMVAVVTDARPLFRRESSTVL